jgi:putative redox protein
MEYKKVTFKNKSGLDISGRMDLPADREPLAYALFAHCFTCTKNLKAIAHICRALTDRGLAVLRFDFTGLGESDGDFSETNFSSNIEDLVVAAEFMKEKFESPGILIGHSLGGAAMLHAGSRIGSTRAVVTIGAPADPAHLKQSLKDSQKKIEKEGQAEIAIGGKSFTVKKQFLDDLEKIEMQKAIRNLKKPLLIFHSPVDEIVDPENAATIFKAAFHPKSFISLDNADHLLSNEADAMYIGSVIAAWAEKYVDMSEKRKWIEDPKDNRVLARIGKTLYRTDILANGHHLVADEPRSVGGGNLGSTPYDLLVSGLGACTCMTLRMYADRKKWPVESISVKLKHQKIHADECQSCETQSGKLDQIDLEIDIKGELDSDQKKRMLEIAQKCPVHRTLHSEMMTNIRLKESDE